MPFYSSLKPEEPADRRTADGLLRLRAALCEQIPAKTTDETLLLATWNIRAFGAIEEDGRNREALFYIAEIISHFDLVAVQEVRGDLSGLDQLMTILGSWWRYLVTDVNYGTSGNQERVAFLYDQRKVYFGGLAGEIVPPSVKQSGKLSTPTAFARSPFIVGLRAGWFKFSICTSHLFYGDPKADDPQRVDEMKNLVDLLKKRIKAKDRSARNIIILGDFNIFSSDDEEFKSLYKAFKTPQRLSKEMTNQSRTKPFDQIAFLSPDVDNHIENARGGVFNPYDYVYRTEDAKLYMKDKKASSFSTWRSYRLSDHLPLWTEVHVDFGEEYLARKAEPVPKKPKRK